LSNKGIETEKNGDLFKSSQNPALRVLLQEIKTQEPMS